MFAPTYDQFVARFPRLVANTAPGVEEQGWIADALTRAWDSAHVDVWGGFRSEAALLETAHRWRLMADDDANVAGPVKGERVGDLSVSFAGGNQYAQGDEWWATTLYGRERLQLRTSVVQFDGII